MKALVDRIRSSRQGWLFGLLAGVGLLVLPGCQSGGKNDPPPASAVQDPVLRDIPKPAGFRMVERTSMAKASGQYRIAQCEYTGSKDRESVRRFYEEYMPEAGFTLKHWGLDKGTYSLNFESDRETCDISIGNSGLQTLLVVKVGPRAEGSTERMTHAPTHTVQGQPAGDRRQNPPPPRRRPPSNEVP